MPDEEPEPPATQPLSLTEESEPPATQPFSLTISGGVSLGSYEAGVNWALVEYLRKMQARAIEHEMPVPQLSTVTGASAGAINSLLTTVTWCQSDAPRSAGEGGEASELPAIDDNLFSRTWLNVGLDATASHTPLMPDSDDDYGRDDGVLTRKAFDHAIDEIGAAFENGDFREDCEVRLGITVTRDVPGKLVESGLTTKNQRFVVPWKASVEDGKMRISAQEVDITDHTLTNILRLATDEDGNVRWSTIVDALEAASAFPMAFSPKRLKHCAAQCSRPSREVAEEDQVNDNDESLHCKDEKGVSAKMCWDDFMDGGVFDNIPLGLAGALNESDRQASKTTTPTSYLFMDPDNRRLAGFALDTESDRPDDVCDGTLPEPSEVSNKKYNGLKAQQAFVSGTIATARSSELHHTLASNRWNRGAAHLLERVAKSLRGFDELKAFAAQQRQRPSAERTSRDHSRAERKAKLFARFHSCTYEGLWDGFRATPRQKGFDLSDAIELVNMLDCVTRTDSDFTFGGDAYKNLADAFDFVAVELAYAMRTQPGERTAQMRERSLRVVAQLADSQNRWVLPALRNLIGPMPRVGIPGPGVLEKHARSAKELIEAPARERRLRLSKRFAPLTGYWYRAFGAFFDREFRRYDYYVGVYDALHSIASYHCETLDPYQDNQPTRVDDQSTFSEIDVTSLTTQRCLMREMNEVAEMLGVAESTDAQYVLSHLLAAETRAALGGKAGNRLLKDQPGVLTRANNVKADSDKLKFIVETFLGHVTECAHEDVPGQACLADLNFEYVLCRLDQKEYDTKGNAILADAMDQPLSWYFQPLSKAIRRLSLIEEQDGHDDGEQLFDTSNALLAAQWSLTNPGVYYSSSLPLDGWDGLLLAVPTYVEKVDGGGAAGWRHFGYSLTPKNAVLLPFPAYKYTPREHAFDMHWLSYSYRGGPIISEVTLGARSSWWFHMDKKSQLEGHAPEDAWQGYGGTLAMHFVANKLRVSINYTREYAAVAGHDPRWDWDFAIGVNDLNGLLFWVPQVLW